MEKIKNKAAPILKKNDIVTLNLKYKSYSNSYKTIIGKQLVVKDSYISNLGDIETEVLYLEQCEGVQNPYLSEHFNKIENETINT
jgi:hypothetical protein